MKINAYTHKGVRKSTGFSLPKEYVEKENSALLAQAIRVYEDNKHPGLSKTKTRSEINLTKRKAHRQKGTGMARHGAKSAPIFVGGSKAHGPKGIKRKLTLSKKMKKKALHIAMTSKVNNSEMVVVNGAGNLTKTKDAAVLIDKIAEKEDNVRENGKFTFVLSENDKGVVLALRNIPNIATVSFRNLNVYDIYFGGMIVIDQDAFGEQKNARPDDKPLAKKTTKHKNK
jgi:large subunit ribosomal protein L4